MKRHIHCLSKVIFRSNISMSSPLKRFLSTQEAIERRHHLFTLEKNRQIENVGRVEKIEVKYKGVPEPCTLIMNKDISTPHDCAKHLSEWHADSSALALINGTTHWDMHRPLSENCTLELLNYTVPEPQQVNRAFWRTCSLLLGACASLAFKDSVAVKLHSFPGPNIWSGSFIYDIDLPTLEDWRPSLQELYTLSAEYVKLARRSLPVERLEVSEELATEMFTDNEHKIGQIPDIAAKNDGKVTLYRVGQHVDISKGPMISNTSHVGRLTVTSVHKLIGSPDSEVKQLYRFQGVALPAGTMLDHFAYSILTERAKKLNPARSPINSSHETTSEPESVAAKA